MDEAHQYRWGIEGHEQLYVTVNDYGYVEFETFAPGLIGKKNFPYVFFNRDQIEQMIEILEWTLEEYHPEADEMMADSDANDDIVEIDDA